MPIRIPIPQDNFLIGHVLPDNSFSSNFTQTGKRPQNYIKHYEPSVRYSRYPKPAQLMQQKRQWIGARSHPPVWIKTDLQKCKLNQLGKFDVIYCDPPWQEYQKRARKMGCFDKYPEAYKSWTVSQLSNLRIDELADSPSFLFLWVGSAHLQQGRDLFRHWGFKRCEDIVWAKTNTRRMGDAREVVDGLNGRYARSNTGSLNSIGSAGNLNSMNNLGGGGSMASLHSMSNLNTNTNNSNSMGQPNIGNSLFVRAKQHCLMGYKGETKKVSDHTFIHPNIDIDVIVSQQPEPSSLQKPTEIYDIIERFCLGRKKIELFGRRNNLRNGWLTLGWELEESSYDLQEYESWFEGQYDSSSVSLAQHNGSSSNIGSMQGGGISGSHSNLMNLSLNPHPSVQTPSWKGGRLMGTTNGIQSLRPKEELLPVVTTVGKDSVGKDIGGGGTNSNSYINTNSNGSNSNSNMSSAVYYGNSPHSNYSKSGDEDGKRSQGK